MIVTYVFLQKNLGRPSTKLVFWTSFFSLEQTGAVFSRVHHFNFTTLYLLDLFMLDKE